MLWNENAMLCIEIIWNEIMWNEMNDTIWNEIIGFEMINSCTVQTLWTMYSNDLKSLHTHE